MTLEKTELQAITDDYVKKGTTDIYFDDNVLLYMLMAGGKFKESLVQPGELVDGGEKIRVFVEYAKSNGGEYSNLTKIEQGKVDLLNAARFPWGGYFASNAVDLDDQVQNNGDAALVKLVQAKIDNIQKTIRDYMGTAVYATLATTGKGILGIGNLTDDTSATTYGSIAEDDISQWKANLDETGGAISYAMMQEIRRTAKVGQSNSKKPNLYITTDVLKDGFERTLQANVRFKNSKLVDAGFDNVLFGGAPVVADDKQTATYMDALNLNYLDMKTHSKYQFTTPKWEYSKDQPDTLVANQRWIGQLVTSHRAAHARYTGLTEPS